MSHYLNFYIKPKADSWDNEEIKNKKEQTEPILLFSYTGGSDIYQLMDDNNLLYYVCNEEGEEQFKEFTSDDIKTLKADLNTSINSFKLRGKAIKELGTINDDILEEQYSNIMAIADYESQLKEVQFLEGLLEKCNWSGNSILINNN